MKRNIGKRKVQMLRYMGCAVLLGSLMFAATPATKQVDAGEKAKLAGSIVSRSGDLIRIREKKSNELVVVAITDTTRIERKRGRFPFYRHSDDSSVVRLFWCSDRMAAKQQPHGRFLEPGNGWSRRQRGITSLKHPSVNPARAV